MSGYLNYSVFVQTIANLMVVPTTDPNFVEILPAIISDGELRCYTDLDFLNTVVRDTSLTLTANSRNFTLPIPAAGPFVVTNNFSVFTPFGTQSTRNQMVPKSQPWIDLVWPSEMAPTTPSVPNSYAMITDQTIVVGPPPDQAYTVEVTGTIRPNALSATNTTTYLTNVTPNLFIAACMVLASAYQQNFSSMGDNPAQALSWEKHYQDLLPSFNTEENRKKYASQGWTSLAPVPLATPPRMS